MIITDIVKFTVGRNKNKTAYKIFVDDEFSFLLYSQDIKAYRLEVGAEVTPLLYDRIITETVYRRAKQKALAILKHMDRTEKELYIKLKDAYYTDDIINRTIEYLKEYNYINDERYAMNYIRLKKGIQSSLAIKTKLNQKGINKEIIEKIITKEYNESSEDIDYEILAINKAIHKKYRNPHDLSREDKQKLVASLYRKGFSIDKIRKCLNSI